MHVVWLYLKVCRIPMKLAERKLSRRKSIAITITGKVVVVLALLTFIATLVVFMNIESSLTNEYENKADLLAYRIEKLLVAERSITTTNFTPQAERILTELGFTSLHLDLMTASLDIGAFQANHELKSRSILVNETGILRIVTMRAGHVAIDELANSQRIQVLVYGLWTLLIVSVLLLVTIRNNVLKPLSDLVKATRRISPANPHERLAVTRVDEFGQLSRFINEMVDQIMIHHAQLQEALIKSEAANTTKSRFLATMSHELRTPLNAVIGYAEMMRDDIEKLDKNQAYQDIKQILDSAWHLLGLINEVLDLSKIEAGKMELRIDTVLFDNLVDDISASFKPLVQQTGNTLTVVVQEGLISLQTDFRRLKQILINLLSNANKFTDHGEIILSITQSEMEHQPAYSFSIRDTGIGIEKQHIPDLFQPFSQIDSSASRQYGGTGLGLAISKQLCSLLRGNITVESSAGIGSTFTVTIPDLPPSLESTETQNLHYLNQKS